MTLETFVRGSGSPVTVVAHGLGASIAETRPIVARVPGTTVFYAARGHGRSPLPAGPLDYEVLGADLAAMLAQHGATQALGVSMGAGALLSLLSLAPHSLERAVLLLPPSLDRPRADPSADRVGALADAVAAGDVQRLEELCALDLPASVASSGPGQAYVRARAAFLAATPDLPALVRGLRPAVPVRDRGTLAAVTAEVLVLAQPDDPLHPVDVAREVAAALPRSRLVVFDQPAVMFTDRTAVRTLVAEFLAGSA